MSIFGELKRRQVIKVGMTYVILGWVVAEVASVLAPALQLPEWSVSFVVLLLILGFPVALFLAWAYELTPDGVRKTRGLPLSKSLRQGLAGRFYLVALVGLVAVFGYVAFDQYVLEERRSEPTGSPLPAIEGTPSVAVLPFRSLSSDPEQEYFSDGISEELLNALAKIPGLRVPSRTSSFAFKATATPLSTIGEQLAVTHVLEGSVRREGSQVRISAQLVDVATNSSLWSESYERELTSIFELQDEIARRVAGALQVRLLPADSTTAGSARTASVEAHDAYLRGLAHLRTRRSTDVDLALASFDEAIELDPEYASAYAMLAATYHVARNFEFMDPEEALIRAEAAANRALELDSGLAEAYYQRGRVAQARGDLDRAVDDFDRAAALGLNQAEGYESQMAILIGLGRRAEAARALEQAVVIDPRNPNLNWMMGSLRLNVDDRSGARGYYRRAIEVEPTSPLAYAGIGDVEAMEGRFDEAFSWYMAGLERDPAHGHMNLWVGLLYLSLGDEARASAWMQHGAPLVEGAFQDYMAEFVPLVWRGEDPERLVELIQAVPRAQMGAFGTRIFRKPLLWAAVPVRAEAFYRRHWPGLFEAEPVADESNVEIVPDVAYLLQRDGREREAEVLLTGALEIFRAGEWALPIPMDPAIWFVEVELLALLGRSDEALRVMRREIDEGWRFGWWLVERDPVVESLRELPAFASMIAEVQADLASQLATMPPYDPLPIPGALE